MTTNCCGEDVYGANPVNIKWNVVRGDTSSLRVEFLDNDETTVFTTTGWSFAASAYDPKEDATDELEVFVGTGYIDIIASAEVTANWGTGYGRATAELSFDLEATLNNGKIWTPIVGTISVIADVTGSL